MIIFKMNGNRLNPSGSDTWPFPDNKVTTRGADVLDLCITKSPAGMILSMQVLVFKDGHTSTSSAILMCNYGRNAKVPIQVL